MVMLSQQLYLIAYTGCYISIYGHVIPTALPYCVYRMLHYYIWSCYPNSSTLLRIQDVTLVYMVMLSQQLYLIAYTGCYISIYGHVIPTALPYCVYRMLHYYIWSCYPNSSTLLRIQDITLLVLVLVYIFLDHLGIGRIFR